MTNVWVNGQEIILNDKNWVTSGGEADIYKVKNKAFKLLKNLKDRYIEERVQFSEKWKHLNIARPESVIKSSKGDVLGLVMPWLDGEPLLMAFNNNWRTDNKVDHSVDAVWTEQIRLLVSGVLSSGARMVDANEWNYMIQNKSKNIWAIDSDSWCIPGIHATAQMLSIKDWHSPVESEESDWFAAAVVSFQLWAGIHPYKGNIDGFKKGDMQERMKKNVSVLHQGVRVPSVTRDWNDIPKGLLSWYHEVFECGGRNPMPAKDKWDIIQSFVVNNILKASATGMLKQIYVNEGLFKKDALIVNGKYWTYSGNNLDWLKTGVDQVWETYPLIYTGLKLENNTLTLTSEFDTKKIEDVLNYWISNQVLWIESSDFIMAFNREDIAKHSYYTQKAKWPKTSNLSRNGNVAWAYELGGMVLWHLRDEYPVVNRIKSLDGLKILKAEQCGKYLVILSKKNSKSNSVLSVYDTNTQTIVSELDTPDNTFLATTVGNNGLFIVVDDGEIWLWNGTSMSKTDGDVLLSDRLFTYAQKPYIERKSKIFRLSNKT